MFEIGKNVFFIDLGKESKIVPGIVVGSGISTTGYPIYDVRTKSEVFTKEAAFVFDDLKAAQSALEEMLPIQHKMNKVKEDAQAELDSLRKQIIGEPKYAHLLEKKQ